MGSTRLKAKQEKGEEKPKKEEKKEKPKVERKEQEIRQIVRVIGTDLDGAKSLRMSLTKVKGIGFSMSNAICNVTGFNPRMKLGDLNEQQLQKVEDVIKNPANYGMPVWIFNRRHDLATGADLHLSGPDFDITRKFDIQRMIDLKTYKGGRHMLGLPARGQRTRSKFRGGRSVGVLRKGAKIQAAAAGTETKKEEKPKAPAAKEEKK
ncbi:MAG: 30S ribosomal protein S13 [Candidatus Aenigmarchaeota archaeon]|nr:30S ribosomal protein S13 [Candidatus Aenigmarchaeota archaeon]